MRNENNIKLCKMVSDCCNHTMKAKRCRRRKDGKEFKLPRKFTRKQCLKGPMKGFSMRSSCAPQEGCSLIKPKLYFKKYDVQIDQNPDDTIPIKFTTVNDVKSTIRKLEKLYKSGKYPHKRIWQVGMIMMVRLRAIHNNPKIKDRKNQQYKLSQKYFEFLRKRSQMKNETERKQMKFIF